MPSTRHLQRRAAGHLFAVISLALAGCAGPQAAAADTTDVPVPTGVVRSAQARPPGPVPKPTAASTALALPTTTARTRTPRRSAPTANRVRSGRTGSCTAALTTAWASWPMPNPKGAGLPHESSYTDLGDGSVRDDITCLVWQRGYSAQRHTWEAAKAYCTGLRIGGRTDWRLPGRVELTSIMDFTRKGPAIDTSVFKGIANFFWTGSPWAVRRDPPYAWLMNFYEGLTSNAGHTTDAFFVRCVSGATGTGAATYTSVAPGEVRDTNTGLIWQRATAPITMSAAEAAGYCAELDLNGHTWRLPSIREIATTVDESRVAPAINRVAFPDTAKKGYYWTSSRSRPQPDKTWGLNYDDGYTNYRNITKGFVRCVR